MQVGYGMHLGPKVHGVFIHFEDNDWGCIGIACKAANGSGQIMKYI